MNKRIRTPIVPKVSPPRIVYVFRCPMCSKTFERVSNTPTIGQHKDRKGYPCGGMPVFETTRIK